MWLIAMTRMRYAIKLSPKGRMGMTKRYWIVSVAALLTSAIPSITHAQEVFLGASKQGVNTPFSIDAGEKGANVQFGIRGEREAGLAVIGAPSLYAVGSVSTSGYTSFIAGGMSWKIGNTIYLRPGIGLALHNRNYVRIGADRYRKDLGSPVLFEPEIAVGARINDHWSAELSWLHISHAQLFGVQNPGLDMIGARLVYKIR
jgi:lipid A 3-O-deacylase